MLAYEVGQGRDEKIPELDAVEELAARLRRDMERQALADEERQIRAHEAEREAREAERLERVDRLKAALAEQLVAAQTVEQAVEQLERAIGNYMAVGCECYLRSGGTRTSRTGERQLRGFLAWRLGLVLPNLAGPKPSHELRLPLSEALCPGTEDA